MSWLELLIPFLVVLFATSCVTVGVAFAIALREAWGRSLLTFLICSAGVALVSALGIFLKVSGLVEPATLSWTVWNVAFFMLALTSWFALETAFLVTRSRPSRVVPAVFLLATGAAYGAILAVGVVSKQDMYFPYIGGIYASTSVYLAMGLGAALAVVWRRRRHLDAANRAALVRFVRIFLPLGAIFLLDELIRLAEPLPWIPLLQLAPLTLYGFVIVEAALRSRRPIDPDDPGLQELADRIAAGCRASPLTRREREILAHLLAGRSNAAVAEALAIAPSTVKNHVYSLFQKVGVGSRSELQLAADRLRVE
jgi:DNA-binding CsgD family transcriptional regulator